MSYSIINTATPRPRDITRTLEIPLDASVIVPRWLSGNLVFGFGEMVEWYVAPTDTTTQVLYRAEDARNLNIPLRRYFQNEGSLYVPTQADPNKLISTNPNVPTPNSFRWLCSELTTIIKTRTDAFTAESYKIQHYARLIVAQLQERSKKDALQREKVTAERLLKTIEEAHKSGRIPVGFEEWCKKFYERIMNIIGESVLDDAVISSLSWERRVAEPIAWGMSFPYNEYPFSCRCWVLWVAFSLLK
jgi:hypothetical protein